MGCICQYCAVPIVILISDERHPQLNICTLHLLKELFVLALFVDNKVVKYQMRIVEHASLLRAEYS